MEDNNSEDEIREEGQQSPKIGSKKLKLNDGSSQDSFMDAEASSSKEEKPENVDSGVSADKSESTSSEDRVAVASEGPSNEVLNVAPSSSNVQSILLHLRPRRGRNYRKRETSDNESDSSSRDSDDLSVDEADTSGSRLTENSDDENRRADLHRFMANLTDESDGSELHTGDTNESSEASNNDYESDELVRMQSGSDQDTDSDDRTWSQGDDEPWLQGDDEDDNEGNDEEEKRKTPDVLLKIRPKPNHFLVREVLNRELGLSFPSRPPRDSAVSFSRDMCSSLHAVQRLERLHCLNKHRGCVNSINFHREGKFLASGSDDLSVVIWDWARRRPVQAIRTGHKSNVFQSKFLYLNARSQLNIATCARDGQVRLLSCPPGGGACARRRLACHARAAHKLHVDARDPHLVLSAGEDGLVLQSDVRADHPEKLFVVRDGRHAIPLYSVTACPRDSARVLVAGRDRHVRVYDRRQPTVPCALYCPSHFSHDANTQKTKGFVSMRHLTCAVYNHDGSEILGSYNDEDIYLFDTEKDVYDKESAKPGYTYRYSGHRNSATFKGVSFFGPKSEFVVSGSDCSHIYIWDKHSESIVHWMQGDNGGVVNCIEPHPTLPVLATSGLDKDVKIWMPTGAAEPNFEELDKLIRNNSSPRARGPQLLDFLPAIFSAWRSERGDRGDRGDSDRDGDRDSLEPRFRTNSDYDGNVCTAF